MDGDYICSPGIGSVNKTVVYFRHFQYLHIHKISIRIYLSTLKCSVFLTVSIMRIYRTEDCYIFKNIWLHPTSSTFGSIPGYPCSVNCSYCSRLVNCSQIRRHFECARKESVLNNWCFWSKEKKQIKCAHTKCQIKRVVINHWCL